MKTLSLFYRLKQELLDLEGFPSKGVLKREGKFGGIENFILSEQKDEKINNYPQIFSEFLKFFDLSMTFLRGCLIETSGLVDAGIGSYSLEDH